MVTDYKTKASKAEIAKAVEDAGKAYVAIEASIKAHGVNVSNTYLWHEFGKTNDKLKEVTGIVNS